MPPINKRRRIGSYYVDRAPSVYSEEASIVAKVLGCDLETLQITFVEVDTTIERTVDPLKYFQNPSSLIIVKTFLEEQKQKHLRLLQWIDDLEARIHLCQEQERFSQESEIICIDDHDDDGDGDGDEPERSRPAIDESREYICIEIEEDDKEDETLGDNEGDKQEEPIEEEEEEDKPPNKSKPKPTSFKVYMPTRDEMAFCCADCRCETTTSIHTIQNGDDSLYHRLCCHKIANNSQHSVFKKAGLWRCPVQLVDEQRTAALTAKSCEHTYDHQGNILYSNRELGRQLARYKKEEARLLRISSLELQRKVNSNQRQQQAFSNADFEALPVDVLKTHPKYDAIQREYQQLVQSIESSKVTQQAEEEEEKDNADDPRMPATVVDFFAGIGSGTVALKRLGIAIEKVVHVEHDKVATHVYRHNHDSSYNLELEDDGIEHVLVPKFEDVEDDLDAFMKVHGPIDIGLGGPPCVDYSAVNAYRKGVRGEQGQYLQRLGKLVHAIRNHKLQRGRPLFFLAENVVLRAEDLDAVSDSFGITPLEVDAHYYSPCRRKRHFFMNFPVDLNFTTLAASSEVTCCLEKNWMHPADAIANRTDERLEEEEEARLRKANTFMASLTRIDDERMTVVKKSETGGFVGRSMMVVERERMMGFPEAYVSAPLVPLFEEVKDAMCKQYLPAVATPWTKEMDSKYHCFSGDMPKLAFDDRPDSLAIKSLLAPPQPNTKKSYFDREGYSKRLLGNAYSVVVAEILLQPLTRIYPTRRYSKFDYEYLWPNKFWTLPDKISANKSTEDRNVPIARAGSTSKAHPIGKMNSRGQRSPLLPDIEDGDRPVVDESENDDNAVVEIRPADAISGAQEQVIAAITITEDNRVSSGQTMGNRDHTIGIDDDKDTEDTNQVVSESQTDVDEGVVASNSIEDQIRPATAREGEGHHPTANR